MIKIDSGLGRNNKELLARLQIKGYILYPEVPNTTDQMYGLFKSIYRIYLLKIASDREEAGLSTSLNMSVDGLLIFGGVDSETRVSTGMLLKKHLLVQNAYIPGKK